MQPDSADFRAITRREAIQLGVGFGIGASLAVSATPHSASAQLVAAHAADASWQGASRILRTNPSSGEKIPAVGVGTARSYDVTTDAETVPLIRDLHPARARGQTARHRACIRAGGGRRWRTRGQSAQSRQAVSGDQSVGAWHRRECGRGADGRIVSPIAN